MTSDEIKKVREAADIVLGRFGCHRADCRDCAKFVFSLVGTDGESKLETNIEQLCSECKIKRVSECSNIH